MPLIQDLPRIDSPKAAWRWARLLGRVVVNLVGYALRARASHAPSLDPADLVVLVTLDGVRPRDLLGPEPAMPFLMGDLLLQGTFLGSDAHPTDMRIGSPVGISMSGYHSIFYGRLTNCLDNEGPVPPGDTLFTTLQRAFPGAVTLISTWDLIVKRVTVDPGMARIIAGRGAAVEAVGEAASDTTDGPAMRAALAALRQDAPRFLYVGLDETDDAAHRNDWARYQRVLARFDGFLRDVVTELRRLQAQGRKVTLIVTTDHGRGVGEEWVEHRWNIEGSDRVWLFAMGHEVAAKGRVSPTRQRTHYDIRPTVEYLLGQRSAPGKGQVITELLKDADQSS